MSPEARERSFDELARGLASGSVSRRKALRLMGAALVGGTMASLGLGGVAGADPPGCKRAGKRCKKDKQCCSGNCSGGTCAACAADRVLLTNGTCAKFCEEHAECAASCLGCFATQENTFIGICEAVSNSGGGGSCTTHAACPTGEYCARSFDSSSGICQPAC